MFRRSLVALVGALVLVGVLASSAFAHVTIKPGEAEQGGFSTQVFQVPNELADASTTQLEVTFPTDHPIAFVSVEAVPGWTVKIDKTTLATPITGEGEDITEAVSKITWSGGTIAPGFFQTFPVSMGPLPDVDSLTFKAVQTYSNGDVVRWIDEPTAGGEAEHPAPVLTLTKAADEASTPTTTATVPKDVATSNDVDSAKTIGIVGVVLGALGLIVAIVALVRKPRTTV